MLTADVRGSWSISMSDIAACSVGVMSVMAKGVERKKESDVTPTLLFKRHCP